MIGNAAGGLSGTAQKAYGIIASIPFSDTTP